MKIERISKIKNYRVFRDFSWPSSLLDFKDKNLIYGWNGTGKSTLSNIFRAIEKRQPLVEGDFEVFIDGNKVTGSAFSTDQTFPPVRVFNDDFVEESVFTTHGVASPILFLGAANIEKQKTVMSLKQQQNLLESDISQKTKSKISTDNALDSFCIDKAKAIKDLLSSSGGNNQYNNYNKRNFEDKCKEFCELTDSILASKCLSVQEKDRLKKQKEATSEERAQIITFVFPDLAVLIKQVECLLKETVVSSVIEGECAKLS